MARFVYADNAATTAVSQEVIDAMAPAFGSAFGNPSSLHSKGREAKELLDWGYANYELYNCPAEGLGDLTVTGGVSDKVGVRHDGFSCVVKKGESAKVYKEAKISERIPAPVQRGEKVGIVSFSVNGRTVGEVDALCAESVKKMSFWELFSRILSVFLLK